MCDDLKLKVGRLQLQPGDTLVVSTERVLSRAQRDAIVATLKNAVQPGVPVFVADGGMVISVARTSSFVSGSGAGPVPSGDFASGSGAGPVPSGVFVTYAS